MQTLEEKAAAIIAVLEGERLKAYQDSGGVWTIGFGHTGTVMNDPIGSGMTISSGMVVTLFGYDAKPLFDYVRGVISLRGDILAQAGWVSFGYNAGFGALKAHVANPESILDYVHDRHGNVVDDLVRRRRFEYALIVG